MYRIKLRLSDIIDIFKTINYKMPMHITQFGEVIIEKSNDQIRIIWIDYPFFTTEYNKSFTKNNNKIEYDLLSNWFKPRIRDYVIDEILK